MLQLIGQRWIDMGLVGSDDGADVQLVARQFIRRRKSFDRRKDFADVGRVFSGRGQRAAFGIHALFACRIEIVGRADEAGGEFRVTIWLDLKS